jgi:O-antigen/teichoic acid export membrane protein
MARRSLLFNSAVYVVGQLVSKALGFVLLVVYARFLQPEDFGVTGTLGAYYQILSTLLLLGVHGSVSKHYFDHKDDAGALRSYLSSVFLFQLAVSLVAVILLDLFAPPAWRHFTSGQIPFHPYVRLMLWVTFFGALTTIPQTVYQSQERAGAVVALQLLHGLAAVSIGVVFVALLHERALGVMRSQLASGLLLALVFVGLFSRQWLTRHVRWSHVRSALRFGLPLVPHTLGSILMQTVDRMMLEKYATLDQVGQYSIAMTLGMILGMVAGGINQAWSPHFLRTMREEAEADARGKAQTFASLFIGFFALLSLVGGLFAPELVALFMGQKYMPAVPYLLPFLIGNLITVCYYLPANQLFLAAQTNWFPIATGIATALSVGLNLWFLPRGGGASAAAWIFVAGAAVQTGIIALAALRLPGFRLLGWRHALVFAVAVGFSCALRGATSWWLRLAVGAAMAMLTWALLLRGNMAAMIPVQRAPRPRP